MDEVDALLPVAPWVLAAASVVLMVALSVPSGGPSQAALRTGGGPLAGRTGAVLWALLAVTALFGARFGTDSELTNPVPALVVGLGWPLLLVVPALVGLVRPPGGGTSAAAWPAVVAALAVVAFLVLPVAPSRPTSVALAVGAYALVVLAGCVAVGRRVVAERFEVLGLLGRWGSVGRALPRWQAPHGALAVLAVVLGGAWFERYERTLSWTTDLPTRGSTLLGLLTSLALAAAGAGLLHRTTSTLPGGTAAAVLLPLALATAVAGVLRRAVISAQLVVGEVIEDRVVDPDPLGIAGGQALALGVVVAGGALASAVLARRAGARPARVPGLVVLLLLTGASAWVVLQP